MTLVCHCQPHEACHGDVLVEAFVKLVEAMTGADPPHDTKEENTTDDTSSDASEASPRAEALLAEHNRNAAFFDEQVSEQADETMEAEATLPPSGIFTHVKWGTYHLGSEEESGLLACGRKQDRHLRMGAWPTASAVWCAICRRHLEAPRDAPATADPAVSTESSD